jgi:uncharacterized membrane protein (UPF0127 family)
MGKNKSYLNIFIAGVVLSFQAQALTLRTLKIGNTKLSVEIAETESEREKGLMFRRELKDGKGMLFIFEREQPLRFWMKNTFIPLSIGYFNKDKELLEIHDMTPVTSEAQATIPEYPSKHSVQYALEVPKGWFIKNKVELHQKFQLAD